jgi:NodT family efflux transporter outer membrane factor (OMF) lipoprotein
MNPRILALVATAALAGCSLAPPYDRPAVPVAQDWKTVEGWRPANPSDGAPRPDWWTAFGDPTLDDFVARALAHNATIDQAAANWRQARAVTRENRASLFPTVTANGQVTHSFSGTPTVTNGNTLVAGGRAATAYRVDVEASWQPDFFGQVTNQVRSAHYTEQARLADLANARLAVEGELVTNYLSLRAADAMIASLVATVDGYQRSLQIATNRYNSGVVARTDVFQAQSQLASAQSDLESERRTRAQYENAIAVLIGENPAAFQLPANPAAWSPITPEVPANLPSGLLERRPDVASAERAVAAANAQIGVARAAFFPTVGLTGQGGVTGNSLSALFSAPTTFWSLGASVAETLLDFGARSARTQQAHAAFDAAAANYRQVALTGFQEVQNDLEAQEILAHQETLLRTASVAADRSEATLRNQYREGLVVYTDVVTAQATAQSARRALLQGQLDRQTAAVALIQALGGGWQQNELG